MSTSPAYNADARQLHRAIVADGPPPPHEPGSVAPAHDPSTPTAPAHGLVTVRLADVKREELRWLWQDRLPLGKLSILAGNPGLGKSTLSLDAAARVSTGRPWPDGSPTIKGDVLIFSCEDGIADTILPRSENAGADLARVHAVTGVRRPGAKSEAAFSLSEDLDLLESALRTWPEVRLIIIDPIGAYVGRVDSHKDAEVRSVLGPLAALADRYSAAVLGLMHLSKSQLSSALYRLIGSIAFVAAARSALLVTEDPDDAERRLVVPIKCNLARRPPGLAYRIDGTPPRLVWDAAPINVDADTLLARLAESKAGAEDNLDPVGWLRELLAYGPVRAPEVDRQRRECAISEARFKGAKSTLGVRLDRQGGIGADGRWFYSLPGPASEAPTA